MRRMAGMMFLFTAPQAFAAEPSMPFWHLSEHGDSILLILLGAFIVRRECLKMLYPEPKVSRLSRQRRCVSHSRRSVMAQEWTAQFANWRVRCRLALLRRLH